MRMLDTLLGRRKQVQPNLDVLFRLPPAACTLQAALDMRATGAGAVVFRQAEGAAARAAQTAILDLLHLDRSTTVAVTTDEFGFAWITCHQAPPDPAALVTALHAVDITLADNGFGSALLCTVVGFTDEGHPERRLALVYLFGRGTFYPFAPTPDRHRDNTLELRARAALARELPIEPDLERWFPLWDAPVP